jgi:hypothetical protein
MLAAFSPLAPVVEVTPEPLMSPTAARVMSPPVGVGLGLDVVVVGLGLDVVVVVGLGLDVVAVGLGLDVVVVGLGLDVVVVVGLGVLAVVTTSCGARPDELSRESNPSHCCSLVVSSRLTSPPSAGTPAVTSHSTHEARPKPPALLNQLPGAGWVSHVRPVSVHPPLVVCTSTPAPLEAESEWARSVADVTVCPVGTLTSNRRNP